MTRRKKEAVAAWQGNDRSNRNTYQGETIVNQITSLSTTTDKDYRGHFPVVATVTTAAGFAVNPDTLLMEILCNGDNPAGFADRGRYLVNA